MRKQIFKYLSIAISVIMILGDNSIISLAEEIAPKNEVSIFEEVLEDEEQSSEDADERLSKIEKREEEFTSEEEIITEESEVEDEIEPAKDVVAVEELNAAEYIGTGTSNNVTWVIDANGKLTITGTGDWERGEYSDYSYCEFESPWIVYCDEITSAEVILSDVTDLTDMFCACSKMMTVDLSGLDTSHVSYMSGMFSLCSSLETVDLSRFDLSNIENSHNIFNGCFNLREIITPQNCYAEVVLPSGKLWRDLEGNSYNIFPVDSKKLIEVIDIYGNIASGRSNDVSWVIDENGKLSINGTGDWNKECMLCNYGPFYDVMYEQPWSPFTKWIVSAEVNLSGCTDLRGMFSECSNLKSVDLNGLDTSDVVSMKDMFIRCYNLTSLDLSSFDTSNVMGMQGMFSCCRNLKEINFENWDTSKVEDYSYMFFMCSSLQSVDLSNFDTTFKNEDFTNLEYMFYQCTNLTTVDISNFDTSDAYMLHMFDCCSGLSSIDLRSNEIKNVGDLCTMFLECNKLESLDFSSQDIVYSDYDEDSDEYTFVIPQQLVQIITPNTCNFDVYIESDKSWKDAEGKIYTKFPGTSKTLFACNKIALLDVDGNIASGEDYGLSWVIDANGKLTVSGTFDDCFDEWAWEYDAPWFCYREYVKSAEFHLDGVTSLNGMFEDYTNLISVDLSGLDTSNVVSMWNMFGGCKKLETIDLSKLNTSRVTDMCQMFYGCSSLQSIELSGINTSEVNFMRSMFAGCSSLTSVDVSNFDTSKVTDMSTMFKGCSNLTSIDVSNFDTSKVSSMSSMFEGCTNLTSVDVSNFNTSKVSGMSSMFKGCSSLSSVDVSNFDTSKVTDMSFLFANCSNLKKLVLSRFNLRQVNSYVSILSGCSDLNYVITPDHCNIFVFLPTGKIWKDSTGIEYQRFPTRTKVLYTDEYVSKMYNISYELNGGTNDILNPDSYMEGETISLKNPTREGYSFDGWFDADTNEKVTVFTDKSITVCAKWTPYSYTISFNGNGGSFVSESGNTNTIYVQEMTYGESRSLKDNKFTNGKLSFVCWNEKADGSGRVFDNSAVVKNLCNENGGNVTLYAMWAEHVYSVTYELNGGMNSEENASNYVGELILADPIRIGYTFVGWFDSDTDAKTTVASGKDLSVYAKWSPISYSITFNGNGGSFVSDSGNTNSIYIQYMTYDKKEVLRSNKFAKENVSFIGWATNPDGTGKMFSDGAEVLNLCDENEGNVVLYAIWAEKEYSITYELNGGINNKDNPDNYLIGNTVTLKNPSKECNTFDGWYDKETNEKVTIVKDKNITVYAKWIPFTYTITLNGNGGKYTPEGYKAVSTYRLNMVYGDSKLIVNPFVRTGYTLAGWTTKKDGKGIFYEAGAEVINLTKTNKGNVNLYAKWEANEYTISFEANASEVNEGDLGGEMLPVTVKYGKSVKLPANKLTRKGYTFKGWSTDLSGKVKFKNKASVKNLAETGNVTLYAVWSINTYSVKYNANGGKGKEPVAVKGLQYGEKTFKTAVNPFTNKECYTFKGWNTKKDGSGEFYDEDMDTNLVATKNKQAIILYATWSYEFNVVVSESDSKPYPAYYNQSVTADQIMEDIPELAKTGQYIAGFAISQKNADKGKMAYKGAVKNAAGKVLYPVYKPVKYTVKFDKNVPEGAKVTGKMSSISAIYGKSFTLKANAFKCSGYTFIGWSSDKNASEAEFANKQKVEENLSLTNKETVTLYAIWEKK